MMSRSVSVVAGAVLVAAVSVGPIPTPRAAAQTGPGMIVDTVSDWVRGLDWPADSSLTLTIGDPGTPEYTQGATADPQGQSWFDLAFDLQPGQRVTLTDETTTIWTVPTPLRVTAVDADADTVSGIAAADRPVGVEVFGGPAQEVTPNEFGAWTADFSPGSGFEFDLVPGVGGNAHQDDNGFWTHVNWRVPNPHFWVNTDGFGSAGVVGNEWASNGSVTIEVESTVESPDATWPTGPDGSFNMPPQVMVVEGDLVTVTDGSSTKTLIVSSLGVAVDAEADTVSGSAPEGTVVSVDVFGGPNQEVVANSSEVWTADFSPDSGFEFDLIPGTHGSALLSDNDGDATNLGWRVPNPIFWLFVLGDGYAWVSGSGWASDGSVTIEVESTVESPDATWPTGPDGSFNMPPQVMVVEGDLVTVTDGSSTKTLIVSSLAVVADAEADTVSGSAPEGTVVSVEVFGGPNQEVVANSAEVWTADFSPDSGFEFDLIPGTNGSAAHTDDDGDTTYDMWQVPNPIFWLNTGADGTAGVSGSQWTPNGSVTIEVDATIDSPDATSPIGPDGSFNLGSPAIMVAEGDLVTVTDGSSTKTLIVSVLVVAVDAEADTVSGSAPEGTVVSVGVFGGPNQEVVANSSEVWTADFSSGSGFEFDLVPGTDGNAVQTDDDGDATNIYWRVPPGPSLQVVLPSGIYAPAGWPDGETVVVEIDDPDTPAGPDFTGTSGVVGQPCGSAPCGPGGWAVSAAPYVIQAGDVVTAEVVGDPAISVTHVVQLLSITEVDFDDDLVTGTAAPGTTPQVTIGPFAAGRNPTADGAGNWTADFSPDNLGGEPPYDLTAADTIVAIARVGQGSTVVVISPPPPPPIDLSVTPNVGLADGQIVALDGTGWPGGETLTVSECRLTVPFSPAACDTNTSQSFTVGPAGTITAGSYQVTRELELSSPEGAYTFDCGELVGNCGLVGVVWAGAPLTSPLLAIDYPHNNPIDFAGALPGPTISGTVLGDGGVVVADSGVLACPGPDPGAGPFDIGCWFGLSSTVDEAGHFEIQLPPDPVRTIAAVEFGPDGWPSAQLSPEVILEMVPGEAYECAFTIGTTPSAACSIADDDGVLGSVEDDAPNNGDGNADGIRDAVQDNVASLPSQASGNPYVTIASPVGTTLANVVVIDPATLPPPPGDAALPVGMLAFEVHGVAQGATVTVDVFTPAGTAPNSYLKFQNEVWIGFTDHATFAGDVVTLTLTDGGAGDGDLLDNGVIIDPGAPAVMTLPVVIVDTGLVPVEPIQVGQAAALTVAFTGASEFVVVDWGDGSTPEQFNAGQSPVAAVHTYLAPGVFTVEATVTGYDGSSDTVSPGFVVVYDPAGGSISVNGEFAWPDNAIPAVAGETKIGTSAKFKHGQPEGDFKFEFKPDDGSDKLKFKEESIDTLVVGTAFTYLHGTGTFEGDPTAYTFRITAIDGNVSGGEGDYVRIVILDGATVVWDTQPGDNAGAIPTTPIEHGQIKVRPE